MKPAWAEHVTEKQWKERDPQGRVPDPHFCSHREECRGLPYCPLDRVCND